MIRMFEISKEIELDCGHRVPLHQSKCKNLHGHRYTVQLTISGPLVEAGAESGMVKDFGFLKEILMKVVHDPYDHKLILQFSDPLADCLCDSLNLLAIRAGITDDVHTGTCVAEIGGFEGIRIILISRPPTAENLARMWGEACRAKLPTGVTMSTLTVYETPTSIATYIP